MNESTSNIPNPGSKKALVWLTIVLVALAVLVLIFQYGSFSSQWLWNLSNEGSWLLPLVAVAALLDSINPCAFSILLLTIAILFSLGKLREKVLLIGFSYIFGLFLVYMLIGLGLLQALHIFNVPHFMGKLGAGILIIFGLLSVIGEVFPSFPIRLRIPHAAHTKISELLSKLSLPVAFILGGLVGLCEFPCTGGPYLMVIGLLHDTSTYFRGFGYLVFYNLIFILPLVIILFIASNRGLLDRVKVWQKKERVKMRLGGGILMIILGLLFFLI